MKFSSSIKLKRIIKSEPLNLIGLERLVMSCYFGPFMSFMIIITGVIFWQPMFLAIIIFTFTFIASDPYSFITMLTILFIDHLFHFLFFLFDFYFRFESFWLLLLQRFLLRNGLWTLVLLKTS